MRKSSVALFQGWLRSIQIRPLAEVDLEGIYFYSYEEFGSTRAIQYIQKLDSAFNRLAENPNLGKKADYIKSGILSFQVVSHVVFFKSTIDSIEIIRIIHKSMDYRRHL